MKEIGLTLGVVESRVSQIHSSAVVRLRVALAGLKSDNSGVTVNKKHAVRMVG
jgi:RNA polymerase sigma factor for flagellar operon FliA